MEKRAKFINILSIIKSYVVFLSAIYLILRYATNSNALIVTDVYWLADIADWLHSILFEGID